MTTNNKEQRSIKRYSIDGLTAQVQEHNLLGLGAKLSQKYMVLDISEGGIHFISRENFKEGTKVMLTVTARLGEKETILVPGIIKRVKEFSGLGAYGIGVEFTEMYQESRDKLNKLIKNVAKAKGDISSQINISAK